MSNSNTSNNIHEILFDESPLLVRPALARKLNDSDMALIVQQVHYWITTKQQLSDDRTFKNGYMWVYNSITKWQEQFTWMPRKTLTRKFAKLREKGVLVADKLNKKKEDRTLWYRIDYEVLLSLPEKNYYEIECKKDIEKKEKEKKKKEQSVKKSESKTEKKEPLGQNVQMYNNNGLNEEKTTKPQSDALGQNGVMHLDKMSQPIPENSLPKISEDLFSKYVCIPVSPIDLFKSIISDRPTKYVLLNLETLTNEYGKDIVNESIKRLADKNTTNYIATIKGIIRKWTEQGMNSFEDIELVEKAYTEQQKILRKQKQDAKKAAVKGNTGNKKTVVRKEMVPDWKKQQDEQGEESTKEEQMDKTKLEAFKQHVFTISQNMNKPINLEEITLDNYAKMGTYKNFGFEFDEIMKIFKAAGL